MSELGVALVAILLVLGFVWAHLVAGYGRSLGIRRTASAIAAILLAPFALVGTFAYAIPGLADFHTRPFSTALMANVIFWAICLGLWAIAAKFVFLALRKPRSEV